MITKSEVINYLKQLSKAELEELINNIENTQQSPDSSTKKICPICGSSHTKKNGKDENNRQRYYCKDCKSSFNDRTGTIFYWSHFTEDQWLKFIDLEYAQSTLENEKHFFGASITTCFFMRQKLYHAATQICEKQILVGQTELDADYLKINLKGTKPHNMPRISKKRGGSSAFRGISHHKICVVCAKDENDGIITQVTGLGSESFDKYTNNKKYFEKVTKIISDSKSSIQQFANSLDIINEVIPTSPIEKRYLTNSGESIASLNEVMTQISAMITKTKGFSTRYMQGYLNFNNLRKQMKYKFKRKDIAKELYALLSTTPFFNNSNILQTELPISLKEAYFEYRYGIFA